MEAHRTIAVGLALRPGKARALFLMASACRFVWNWAVRENRDDMQAHYASQCSGGPGLPKPETGFFSLCKRFTHLRNVEQPWLREHPSQPVRFALSRFAVAYKAFFDDVKAGRPRNMAPPKFHSRDHRLWVTFPAGTFAVQGKWLRLAGVGWCRMRKASRLYGEVKQVHLRSDDGWRWCAVCSVEADVEAPVDNGLVVGVDVNVGQYADSTGRIFLAPRRKKLEARKRRYDRMMKRRRRGSNRYKVAKRRHAKTAALLAGRQRNWQHHRSKDLADRYGTVAMEDLRLSAMTRSAKGTVEAPGSNVRAKAGLNRELLAMSWGQFRQMVDYKAARLAEVPAAYTSQTCPECGCVDAANRRTQAEFVCVGCGHRDNADVNAALNIKAEGKRLLDVEVAGVVRASEASTTPCEWSDRRNP